MLRKYELTYVIENEVLLVTTEKKASTCLVTRTYPVGDLAEKDDYDTLVDAIVNTVKPLTWEDGGGPGRIEPLSGSKSLVIAQTQAVHDEILQLLRSLREAHKTAAATVSSK